MPSIFKAFRSNKDTTSRSKPRDAPPFQFEPQPHKPQWDDAWTRKKVAPEEVRELIHVCSQELKSRGIITPNHHVTQCKEKSNHSMIDLELPFLLLPFRPNADTSAAKTFIRAYFKYGEGPSSELAGVQLQREVRLIEPLVRNGPLA